MKTALQGKAWLFGARVTTDDILPGKYLDRSNDEVGQFAMAGIDPGFAGRIAPGDLIVAGLNFGIGSGRESAVYALLRAGIAAVIAPSFSRLFYRNAINAGLPAIIADLPPGLHSGVSLSVDLEARTIRGPTFGPLAIRNLSGTPLAILRAGGIVPFTKARLRQPLGGGP